MQLPDEVSRLLWEYGAPATVEGEAWERLVIERVMERGSWSAMRWLRSTFDTGRLQRFLERRGRRSLPPRELRFWALVTGVPSEVADGWVCAARAARWQGRSG